MWNNGVRRGLRNGVYYTTYYAVLMGRGLNIYFYNAIDMNTGWCPLVLGPRAKTREVGWA